MDRIDWIDMAKGYGIICVILGHISIHSLSIMIYSFHIPLFFFLSGFLFNENRPFIPFLVNKVKTLLIPYLFFAILYICYYNGFDSSLNCLKTQCLDFLFQQRKTPLWFMTSLFVANVMFYALLKIVRKIYFQFLVSLFVSLFIAFCWYDKEYSMYWNVDISLFVIPYMLIAKYTNKYGVINTFGKFNKFTLLFCLISLNVFIGVINYIMSGEMIDLYNNTIGYYPLSYLEALCGIFAVLIISTMGKQRIILYIGKNSLVFFALHLLVYDFVRYLYCQLGIFQSSLSLLLVLVRDLISVLLIIVFLYPLNELILLSRLRFLLGR